MTLRSLARPRRLIGLLALSIPVVLDAAASAQARGPAIALDAATTERLGIETVVLEAFTLEPETDSSARVLDPAPLAALTAEIAAVEAGLPAARADAERTARLFDEEQNVSARVRDEAAARLAGELARLEALRLRLSLEWGAWIARLGDRGLRKMLGEVAAGRVALVRVELEARRSGAEAPSRLTLSTLDDPERTMSGTPLGALPGVEPQLQTPGWLFRVDAAPGLLPVGRLLLARVPTGAAAEKGVVLPSSALVRREGALWVFVVTEAIGASGETSFERRAVSGGRPVAGGWFAPAGFAPGERVVSAGSADLIAAEQSSGPEPAAEEDD